MRRLVLGLFLCAFIVAVPAFPDEPPRGDASPYQEQKPAAQVDTSRVEKDLAADFRSEREILERQADRQMSGVQQLANLTMTALSIIGVAALTFIGWTSYSTRRELKKSIQESIDEQVKTLVADNAATVLARLRTIEAEVESLARYQSRSVVWVARDDSEAGGDVVSALRENGISNLRTVVPQLGEDFEIGTPELVIISYLATEESSRQLRVVVDALRDRAPPVPLLVHTFNPNGAPYRIEGVDAELLSRYSWFVPTNFPLQLVGQTLTLLKRPPTVRPQ